MLSGALVSGIAATTGIAGNGGITPVVLLLLLASALLVIRPVYRLSGIRLDTDRGRGTIIAAVFGANLVATLFFFPPEEFVNREPVLTLDHALHYQQVVRAKDVFGETRRLHTYDPYFMAGYPGGTVFDIDSKGVELWCALSGPVGTPRAFKIFIMIGYLLFPLSIYAGSRKLGFDFREAVLSTLILMACWHWGRPYISEFRYAGMFSCLTISHVSLYLAGSFRAFLRDGKAPAFWIAGPLAFLVHPTPAVLLPVPFLTLFLLARKKVPSGRAHTGWELKLLARLVAWCLLVLAVNAIWLIPFFRYLDVKTPSETFFQIHGLSGLAGLLLRPGMLPALMLFALAAAGTVCLIRNGRSPDAAAPSLGSLFLIVIAIFGIYIPLFDQMEPGRFLVPALIFMAPLSGPGLIAMMRGAGGMLSSRGARAALVTLLLVCSPVFSLLASRAYYRHALSTEIPAEAEQMIEALKLHTDPPGRLMIEDGPAWDFGEIFLPAVIPMHTGVEQIGGPYPWAFIKHNFTNFHMCRAMGEDLTEMGWEKLKRYLELYDVRWILTTTPECTGYVTENIGSDPLWASEHFTLWETGIVSLGDRGISIKSDYGSIEVYLPVDDAGNVPERVLLPYHWDRGLTAEPPAEISGEQRMSDPVPFLVLEPNGVRTILIEYR
jgi:hypothetical protein